MSSTLPNCSGVQQITLLQVCANIRYLPLIYVLTYFIAMIFLKDNTLVERKLTHDDIKPRLLGHWGTCPGLVMVYAHLNRIIRKTNLDALYVVGPGITQIYP